MPASARHLPADQRRLATIDAAIALAADGNPAEVTTGAIAARMGVTQPALFRHFATKDEIWAAVMEWVAEQILDNVRRASERTGSPLDVLEAIFMGHVEFVARHPGVPRILLAELQRGGDTPAKRIVQALLRRYGERVTAVLELGKQRGQVAPDVDSSSAATLFTGAIQGLVVGSLVSGRVSRLRADAPGAFAIYRRGIASRR